MPSAISAPASRPRTTMTTRFALTGSYATISTPPRPEGTSRNAMNYLTPEGAKKLSEELQKLLNAERPRVVQEVTEAAAQGDRSENAEYIYGKKRLREIDRRIRFLTKRLES